MKKERFSEAINGIDEDIIVSADRIRQKKKKPQFGRWIALAACLCLILTGILAGRGPLFPEKITEEEDITEKTYVNGAIAQANYPEMAAYPNEMDFIDEATGNMDSEAYAAQYDAWRASLQVQREQPEGYQDGVQAFFETTTRQFLSGGDGKNRVYSPVNVYMALGMLAEVTDGDSRQQILDLLGTDNMESLRKDISALWNANYCDDGRLTSILGNSIWLNQGIPFNQSTLDSLAKNHYASSYQGIMGSEEMNQMLRDWLNAQTGGLLKEQVSDMELDSNTILALASTIYFRAKWIDEFSKEQTSEDVFHGTDGDITCDFMHQSGGRNYYRGEGFSAVAQGLEGSGCMWLILPEEGISINELLAEDEVTELVLTGEWDWKDSTYLKVNLSMPKFDVVSSMDLIEGLEKLGISDVFDSEKADFSPMTEKAENISVSKITHAARVKVDEEGCEAAAFTVIATEGAAGEPEEEIDFVLNRPFLFVITSADGVPLFTGVVNQPS